MNFDFNFTIFASFEKKILKINCRLSCSLNTKLWGEETVILNEKWNFTFYLRTRKQWKKLTQRRRNPPSENEPRRPVDSLERKRKWPFSDFDSLGVCRIWIVQGGRKNPSPRDLCHDIRQVRQPFRTRQKIRSAMTLLWKATREFPGLSKKMINIVLKHHVCKFKSAPVGEPDSPLSLRKEILQTWGRKHTLLCLHCLQENSNKIRNIWQTARKKKKWQKLSSVHYKFKN